MHNRLWLSVLLALFLAANGCAKHEDSASADASYSAGQAESAVAQPEPAAKAPLEQAAPLQEKAAEQRAEPLADSEQRDALDKKKILQDQPGGPKPLLPAAIPATTPATAPSTASSTTDAATNAAGAAMEMDSAGPQKSDVSGPSNQANKPQPLRKKEGSASEENAKPSGDDMERMD